MEYIAGFRRFAQETNFRGIFFSGVRNFVVITFPEYRGILLHNSGEIPLDALNTGEKEQGREPT